MNTSAPSEKFLHARKAKLKADADAKLLSYQRLVNQANVFRQHFDPSCRFGVWEMSRTTLITLSKEPVEGFFGWTEAGVPTLLSYPVVVVKNLPYGTTNLYFRPGLETMEVTTRIQ